MGFRLCLAFSSFLFFWDAPSIQAESAVDQVLNEWKQLDSHQEVQSLTKLLLKKSLTVAESRELIGELKRIISADQFSSFMTGLVHAYAQQSFERLEAPTQGMWFWRKSSEELARALKIYWRKNFNIDSEIVFLALMHFSKNEFKDLSETLDFYYKDSLLFFPPDLKEGKTDLINVILFHLSDQLARWNQWFHKEEGMSIEKWSQLLMILEFPRLLLKNFEEPGSSHVLFPWPSGAYAYYHSRFMSHYERALKQIFASASNSQMLILAARLAVPDSLDVQHFYRNLLIDYAEKLARYALSFRDFGAYIENSLPEDKDLKKKIEEIGRAVNQKNLPMLASVELFLKELKQLSSQERAKLKVIEQIGQEIVHHDYCQKMLTSLGGVGP